MKRPSLYFASSCGMNPRVGSRSGKVVETKEIKMSVPWKNFIHRLLCQLFSIPGRLPHLIPRWAWIMHKQFRTWYFFECYLVEWHFVSERRFCLLFVWWLNRSQVWTTEGTSLYIRTEKPFLTPNILVSCTFYRTWWLFSKQKWMELSTWSGWRSSREPTDEGIVWGVVLSWEWLGLSWTNQRRSWSDFFQSKTYELDCVIKVWFQLWSDRLRAAPSALGRD